MSAEWTITPELADKVTDTSSIEAVELALAPLWPIPDAMSFRSYPWAAFISECGLVCTRCAVEMVQSGERESLTIFTLHHNDDEVCVQCDEYIQEYIPEDGELVH